MSQVLNEFNYSIAPSLTLDQLAVGEMFRYYDSGPHALYMKSEGHKVIYLRNGAVYDVTSPKARVERIATATITTKSKGD